MEKWMIEEISPSPWASYETVFKIEFPGGYMFAPTRKVAALTAAAPDLLAALEMALRYVPHDGEHERDTREAAQAAIAKAHGEF